MNSSTIDDGRGRVEPIGFDALMERNRQALTLMAEINGQLSHELAAISNEWIGFLNRRLVKALDLPRQVTACKTVEEVYKVYGDFLLAETEHYRLKEKSATGETTKAPAPHAEEEVAASKGIPGARNMLVRDAMTSKAEWITPDLPIREVAARLCAQQIGCLPVGENDRLIGMITDRDLVRRGVATGADPSATSAREVMSKGIVYCFDDEPVESATRLMEKRQVHHLPVLNREKRMIGILSMGDLALKGSREIFGEVFKLASRDAARRAHLKVAS
jgi:CBS domain-containing protein